MVSFHHLLLAIVTLFSLHPTRVVGKVITVDESDSSILYDGCFTNTPSNPCPQCGDNPDRSQFLGGGWADCNNGQSMVITFTGTSLSLYGATASKNYADISFSLSIDGGPPDLFHPEYFSPQRYKYLLGQKTGLPNRKHRAEVNWYRTDKYGVTLFDFYTYDDGSDLPPPPPQTTSTTTRSPQIPTTTMFTSSIPNNAPEVSPSTANLANPTDDNTSTPGSGATGSETSNLVSTTRTPELLTVTASGTVFVKTLTPALAAGTLSSGSTNGSPGASASTQPPIAGTETNSASASESAGELNIGAIAGGSAAGVLFLALLVALFLSRLRRVNQRRSTRQPQSNSKLFIYRDESPYSSQIALGNMSQQPPPGYGRDPPSLLPGVSEAAPIPGYSRADENFEAAQLAAWVSQNSDLITPDLAERLHVARYRPAYDPDMTSLTHWWDFFKVSPFEVGLLRTLYRASLEPDASSPTNTTDIDDPPSTGGSGTTWENSKVAPGSRYAN